VWTTSALCHAGLLKWKEGVAHFQEENYKCYNQEGLTTCSAMRVELPFNSKSNYVSGFHSVRNISFEPCRSLYFQEENNKCYKQEGLTNCSAMRLELAFNSKTNYVSAFYTVKNISFAFESKNAYIWAFKKVSNISFVPCRSFKQKGGKCVFLKKKTRNVTSKRV
jgi:hypothetical protein